MKKGSKAAIICCSNGQPQTNSSKIQLLRDTLLQLGLVPVFSDCIYDRSVGFCGTGRERAESLMHFYRDPEIEAVFDISGGDMANEILPYLDFELIGKNPKMFWGYSDLTTVINAIYAKTGKKSILYQIRNLIYEDSEKQISNFTKTVFNGTDDLFSFHYEFLQKDTLQGIVAGGNIRCLLKLAGTEYFPDMDKKVLFLESFHGTVPQMVTYFSQLKQMGIFDKITGILLGTFTEMERDGCRPSIAELAKQYAGTSVPIAQTKEIGHGTTSKAIVIGGEINLKKA